MGVGRRASGCEPREARVNLLAIDPGEKEFGYAYVRREGARARYLSAGKWPATRDGFVRLLGDLSGFSAAGVPLAPNLTLVVETPDGFIHQPFRGPGLLRSARVAGGIEWFALGAGIPLHGMTAEQWRKPLTDNARASDAEIAAVVRANILGLPAQTNVHSRDALGLALVSVWCSLSGVWPTQKEWNRTTKGRKKKAEVTT